jgi:hypothetical protein
MKKDGRLNKDGKHTTYTQHIHNIYTTYTQHIHNIYTTYTQHIHNIYTTNQRRIWEKKNYLGQAEVPMTRGDSGMSSSDS